VGLIRCFLAIDPGAALRARLVALHAALAARFPSPALRWIAPEDYHLTLVFLGQVRVDEVVRIRECVAAVTPTLVPLRYRLAVARAFPDAHKPRVLAALPDDPQPLLRWHAPLAFTLAQAGFAIEHRAYRPHLSLARWKGRPADAQPADLALELDGEARAVTLYESRGGHYWPLFRERCGRGLRSE